LIFVELQVFLEYHATFEAPLELKSPMG